MKSERRSECLTRRETGSSPFKVKLTVWWDEGRQYSPESELSEVLRTMGDVLSEEETEEFIAEADMDGDGTCSDLII